MFLNLTRPLQTNYPILFFVEISLTQDVYLLFMVYGEVVLYQ